MSETPEFNERHVQVFVLAALLDFMDWMYEHGPDPNLVTRDRLFDEYRAWRWGDS
jgi:hypothetical protein